MIIYIYIYIISLVRVWLVLRLNFVLLYLVVDFIAVRLNLINHLVGFISYQICLYFSN